MRPCRNTQGAGHLRNYIIGSGLVLDVVSDVDAALAQDVMDYLETFTTFKWDNWTRSVDSVINLFRDGEDALRLFPVTSTPRFDPAIPGTNRGPHNEINGPWAYGVLTSWPWDYEDVQAYHAVQRQHP